MPTRRAPKTPPVPRPRKRRPQPRPTVPRASVQVAEFPLSRDATAEPPKRSALGRRYDARMEGRKGSTRGPKLHVRPVAFVRLVVVAAAVVLVLAVAGWL